MKLKLLSWMHSNGFIAIQYCVLTKEARTPTLHMFIIRLGKKSQRFPHLEVVEVVQSLRVEFQDTEFASK